MSNNELKTKMLIAEAKRWVGTSEEGNNSGQIIESFQKVVDGVAGKEAWCMAFVQSCLKYTRYYYDVFVGTTSGPANIPLTEHCMTAWNKTPAQFRSDKPVVGSVVIWNHYQNGKPSFNGHTGIVTGIKDDEFFTTIEGNTGPSAGVQREGDGVYEKTRSVKGLGNMHVVGFLLPWA